MRGRARNLQFSKRDGMLQIVQAKYIPIEKVRVAKRNPRVNLQPGDREYEAIKSSLQKWGQLKPLIINTKTGRLVDGHQRLKVMRASGWKKVWVTYRVFAKEHDAREATLALHTAEGKFDDVQLKLEVEELQGAGQDLGYLPIEDYLPDFSEPKQRSKITEDKAPKPQAVATSKPGELYQLGKHALLCGDATNAADVQRLLGEHRPAIGFHDPPYGIDYSGGRTQTVRKREYGKIKNDNLSESDTKALIANVFVSREVYICTSPKNLYPFIAAIRQRGLAEAGVLVWDKGNLGLGYMRYRRQCEFILYVPRIAFRKGEKTDCDLWAIPRDPGVEYVHGTQKPVAVPARAIENSSKPDEVVIDFFAGSGSTLIASEQLGRICLALELDPVFCDVIRKRWWIFTQGKEEGWEKGTPQIT